MQIRSVFTWIIAAALLASAAASVAMSAEQGKGRGNRQGAPGGPAGGPGGRGGFGMGGMGFGGGGLLGLLRIDEVKKEIELSDEQAGEVNKYQEELRNQPQDRPNFQNFRDMSDEERQKAMAEMQKRQQEQAKKAKAKLADILLPQQMERLEQISIQVQGTRALSDEEVATKLKITPEQKTKLETVTRENMESAREKMQDLRGGDPSGFAEKMAELRKESDAKLLGVLTDEQKAQFEKMKGEAFKMPEFGRGGRDDGGNRGNRRPRNN